MNRFRKILIPISGDPVHQPVLTQAARLAKDNKAVIKLIAVVNDLPWYSRLVIPSTEELQASILRNQSDALEGLAQPLRQAGLEVATEVLTGRPYLETVREVKKGGHDLVMKEAEPNKFVLFGSTDMRLLETCPCPIWLLKPGHGGGPFSKILAAVDPLPPRDDMDLLNLKPEVGQKEESLDVEIFELAASLAENGNAELHIVHAWSAPGERLIRGEIMLDQEQIDCYVADSRDAARKALENFLAKFPAGPVRRFVHLIKGDSADVIADFAKSAEVNLIVMGTVARTGIAGLLMGNTAETILQRVDCSVLAVKPDGFVSPVV